MNTPHSEIENSIRLALEAADAATESAEEVSRLGAAAKQSAEKLETFAKIIKPVALGCLAGAVVSVALAGLVYMRTLSEMRAATATHIEALAVFTTSIDELRDQIEVAATSVEASAEGDDGSAQRHAEVMEALAAMQDTLTLQAELTGEPGTTEGLPQLLRGVTDAIESAHTETRDTFTAGLSDLQLSVARMLADELAPQPAKPTPAAAAPAPRPAPSRPRPVKAAPNPLKFP